MAIRTHLITTGVLLALVLGPAPGPTLAGVDTEAPLEAKADKKQPKKKKFKPKGTWKTIVDTKQAPLYSPRSLAIDPADTRRLYVGTNGSRGWRTTDRGKTWTLMGTLPNSGEFKAMLVCPGSSNVVLAASPSCGLFRSVDAGLTWTPLGIRNGFLVLSSRQYDSPATYALAALATNPPTIVASVHDGTRYLTYRSVDSGATWTSSGPLKYSSCVQALATAPSDPNTVYALTGHHLYKSCDAARTWTTLTVPSGSFCAVAVHPGNPGTLYLAEQSRGIWRTLDGGGTWTCLIDGLPVPGTDVRVLVIDPANPSILYTGGGYGFFTSHDGGDTWTQMATVTPVRIDLDPGDHNTLYVCDHSTIWRCTLKGR